MNEPNRYVGVLMGDTHCGLRNGIIAPGTELEYDGGEKREALLSDQSKWLWDSVWLPGIDLVKNFAGDDPVYLFHDGDVLHGGRFVEHLYSPFQDHQIQIAKSALAAWRVIPSLAGMALAFGTRAHDYGEMDATKQLAADIAAWGLEVATGEHLRIDLGGALIDIAHHGPSVGTDNNIGNMLRTYTRRMTKGALERGERHADILSRGHVHQDALELVDTPWGPDRVYTWATITPPLCTPNGFGRQASRQVERARCGFVIFQVVGGKVVDRPYPWIVERDVRRHVQMGVNFGGKNYTGSRSMAENAANSAETPLIERPQKVV